MVMLSSDTAGESGFSDDPDPIRDRVGTDLFADGVDDEFHVALADKNAIQGSKILLLIRNRKVAQLGAVQEGVVADL